MGLSIQLADGQSVIAYENTSGVWFQTADEVSGAIGSSVLAGAVNASWIGLKSNLDGGFAVAWAEGGALYEADYSSSGALTAAARRIASWNAPPAALGFTSAEASLSGQLLDGSQVTTTVTSMRDGQAFNVQLTDSSGAAIGLPYVQPLQHLSDDFAKAIAPLATGGYAVLAGHAGALLPGAIPYVVLFDGAGHQIGPPITVASGAPGGPGVIAGLADGGFATTWADVFSGTLYLAEFAADGSAAGPAVALGQQGTATPQIVAFADGRYEVSWSGQHQMFTEAHPALGAADPPPPSESATQSRSDGDSVPIPVGSPVTLSASAGWTSAAVLSNGTLAVVGAQDGGYGSHVGVEQTYDGSGARIASAALMGYAGAGQVLQPEVSALAGGFYQVNYAGSGDYEIYDTAGQRVFAHNAYTSPTAAITPLLNGGYVQTDSSSSQFSVHDGGNNAIGWFSLPPDAPSAPSQVLGLGTDGGFVFSYAHSAHYDLYGGSGQLLAAGNLAASPSEFATAIVALPGSSPAFAEAWLSYDGGQGGFATSLKFQELGPAGEITSALEIGQDLDPWHTQFALQAHTDNSVAILWSQGGAAWGAQYANGAVGPVHTTGVAVSLSDMRVVELPNDAVGLAWLQGGDAWAEIFDPATGAVQRADLGAATGDLSTLHAIATAAGGVAVSWHDGLGIEAAVLGPDGVLGVRLAVPGDLLGVDSHGHALAVHDSGGVPVLQAYALNDGLFWAAG